MFKGDGDSCNQANNCYKDNNKDPYLHTVIEIYLTVPGLSNSSELIQKFLKELLDR
jgi:hypothetical protein